MKKPPKGKDWDDLDREIGRANELLEVARELAYPVEGAGLAINALIRAAQCWLREATGHGGEARE